MNSNSCKPPKCLYSKKKNECIKPNPYATFISQCVKIGKDIKECKLKYYQDIDKIKKNICDLVKLRKKILNLKGCPKHRQPKNGLCPYEYKILKKNKYDIDCCYKEPIVKKPINPFLKSKESSKRYLNKEDNKYFKVINKYQNKKKPIKIKKLFK